MSVDRLEENGVLTDASIKTQDPDETLDFNFSSTNVINKIIMKVSCHRKCLSHHGIMIINNVVNEFLKKQSISMSSK